MNWILEHCQKFANVKHLNDGHTNRVLRKTTFSVKKQDMFDWEYSLHMRGIICLSIFRLHKVDETTPVLICIDPYLILNDSPGSSGKVTPATSCAPVST
jgi:hypothetical protein